MKIYIKAVNHMLGQEPYSGLSNILKPDMRDYVLSSTVNMKHLERVVYLSNNILQLKNITYIEVRSTNKIGGVIFYAANDTADDFEMDKTCEALNNISPLYQKAYLIAYGCCLRGEDITAGDMIKANAANKLMKYEIEESARYKAIKDLAKVDYAKVQRNFPRKVK